MWEPWPGRRHRTADRGALWGLAVRRRLIGVFIAVSGIVICSAGSAGPAGAADDSGVSWGKAQPVPGLAALALGNGAQVNSVSCASPGNCGAVGWYGTGAADDSAPFVESQLNGVWGTAKPIPGLTALDAETARLLSVSCASAGNCTAVGEYTVPDADAPSGTTTESLAVSEVDGTWRAPVTDLAPAGAVDGQLLTVSCWSAGDCAAGGDYFTYDPSDPTEEPATHHALVADEVGGVWRGGEQVPGTAELSTGDWAAVTAISCAPGGGCAASGTYDVSVTKNGLPAVDEEAFVVSGSAGSWGGAREAPGFTALNTGGGASVNSISCASAGNCAAGGYYVDAKGRTEAFIVSAKASAWGAAAELPGTAALNVGGNSSEADAQLVWVSCPAAGDCAAVGEYLDAANHTQAFVASQVNGGWHAAQRPPGMAALPGGGVGGALFSVSCASPGNCSAGGIYETSGGATEALVVDAIGGTWENASGVPGAAALNTGEAAGLLSVSCAAAGNCSAGGAYDNAADKGQGFVVSSQGCQQITRADGSYEFGGCVTEEDSGSKDVTDQQSNVDGVDISASDADQVNYDDGGSVGHAVTSNGASTLSLDLDGSLTQVSSGKLDDKLTGPITVDVPAPAGGAATGGAATAAPTIRGIPISGKLTLTPKAGGTASGRVTGKLPPVLGGGQGTLTFTTTVNKGLSDVRLSVAKASFLRLFNLSKLTLSYDAATARWSVSGTASSGGKTATAFSGSLGYSGSTLESASLSVGKISLAGLLTLAKLKVSYADGAWSGTATMAGGAAGNGGRTATIALKFNGTSLASGSISASDVALFGVLDVSTFELSYSGGSWHLAVSAGKHGAGGSASLTDSGGVITSARLKVTGLSFLGKFTVSSAEISYAQSAPNDACPKVPGQEIWCGSWQVQLPQALAISGVSGALAVDDGTFHSGSIDVEGSVPLFDGIFLTKLGAGLDLGPPVTISGDVGLSFGPRIAGTSLLAVVGTLTRTLPGGGTSGSYVADGTLNALNVLKGTVKVTVPGDGSATAIALTATASAGGASATGRLTGTFTADTFSLGGTVEITVDGIKLTGTLAADDKGMAACGAYHGHKAGFEYHWDTRSVTFLGTKGCTEAGFLTAQPTGGLPCAPRSTAFSSRTC